MWTCWLRRIREIGGKSYRLKNCLQRIGSSDGRCLWDARRMAQMGSSSTPLVFRILPRQSGRGPTSRDYQWPISLWWSDQLLCRGWVRQRPCISQRLRCWGHPDPGSPQTIAFEELGDSSVPLSPNCVQVGRSQEMPADGSLFGVSPDTPGFVMRPAGTTQRLPGAVLPLLLAFDYVSDPFFEAPIAFAQCTEVLGSDGPMILPVYMMPTGASLMMGQSSILTVLVSPHPVQWSTDTDQSDDATREGPFEAVASPMDTEDSPLVTTGLPGCPYRMTSYAGPALADMNPSIIRGSWSSSVHQSRLGCCTTRHRFGWIGWAKSVPWQRRSTYRGTLTLCYRIFRFCHSLLRRCIGCRQR